MNTLNTTYKCLIMCECYQIGGRFIAEDPDCPLHGYAAQQEQKMFRYEIESIVETFETFISDNDEKNDTLNGVIQRVTNLTYRD